MVRKAVIGMLAVFFAGNAAGMTSDLDKYLRLKPVLVTYTTVLPLADIENCLAVQMSKLSGAAPLVVRDRDSVTIAMLNFVVGGSATFNTHAAPMTVQIRGKLARRAINRCGIT